MGKVLKTVLQENEPDKNCIWIHKVDGDYVLQIYGDNGWEEYKPNTDKKNIVKIPLDDIVIAESEESYYDINQLNESIGFDFRKIISDAFKNDFFEKYNITLTDAEFGLNGLLINVEYVDDEYHCILFSSHTAKLYYWGLTQNPIIRDVFTTTANPWFIDKGEE